MIYKLSQEEFKIAVEQLRAPIDTDVIFLYKVYEASIDGIIALNDTNIFQNINGINNYDVINYCIGEYIYLTSPMKEEDCKSFLANDNNINTMASIVADKYLSLSMFNYNQKKFMNYYLPPISSMNLYLNFLLNVINSNKKNEPHITLVSDLLNKSISISRCILSLLVDGYVTEAFATWRTLHECECTLILLEKYGNPLINLYLKHMKYGIAYKNGISDKNEQDQIFVEIKSEMAEHGLKSKDMKKYIEYGWLYGVKEFNDLPNGKLNFKDGLEAASGVTQYGNSYNLSSEIVHATPMLIYSNKDYFYYVTLLYLYECFFRLEKAFISLYSHEVDEAKKQSYLKMRKVYYAHLVNIYNREKSFFISRNLKH